VLDAFFAPAPPKVVAHRLVDELRNSILDGHFVSGMRVRGKLGVDVLELACLELLDQPSFRRYATAQRSGISPSDTGEV
jgi:hypothetical protein